MSTKLLDASHILESNDDNETSTVGNIFLLIGGETLLVNYLFS